MHSPHLGDNDVTESSFPGIDEAVQNELGHLGGLTAAGGPTDDDHWIAVDHINDHLLRLEDGQRLALLQHLKRRIQVNNIDL